MSFKVLIVEDDIMVQGLLRLTLENQNHMVTVASSATEMWVQIQQESFDLVILDLGLPDADGLNLISEIRSTSTVPILVSSAREGASDRVAALKNGADDYLTKPFDPAEMILRVRNLLVRCAAGQAGHQQSVEATNTLDRTAGRRASDKVGPVPAAPRISSGSPASSVPESARPLPEQSPASPLSADGRVIEPSLQAALKKSAPHPPATQGKSTGNIDKSVIIAGLLAILAFGGAGFYWYSNTVSVPGWMEKDTVADRQDRSQNGASPEQADAAAGLQPRRGALQPPREPDIPIAESANVGLTNSGTSNGASSASRPPPSDVSRRQRESDLATLPATPPVTATGNRCDPLPDVKWWRVKTHYQIIQFVDENHNGDWRPYLNNWRARITKLQDIAARGSGIKTSTGEILQGQSLARYIRDTADRIAIIQCLSRESRISN